MRRNLERPKRKFKVSLMFQTVHHCSCGADFIIKQVNKDFAIYFLCISTAATPVNALL